MLVFGDKVEHSKLSEELSRGVNIQEETIVQAFYSTGVARPHAKLVLINLNLLACIEICGKLPYLIIILFSESTLDKLTLEIHDDTWVHLLPKFIGLFVKRKRFII